jgi:hypothetical protein
VNVGESCTTQEADMPVGKPSRLTDTVKVGRKDHPPGGDVDRKAAKPKAKNQSWSPGDAGQGGEGKSKGYGGSAGSGTGPSGPDEE